MGGIWWDRWRPTFSPHFGRPSVFPPPPSVGRGSQRGVHLQDLTVVMSAVMKEGPRTITSGPICGADFTSPRAVTTVGKRHESSGRKNPLNRPLAPTPPRNLPPAGAGIHPFSAGASISGILELSRATRTQATKFHHFPVRFYNCFSNCLVVGFLRTLPPSKICPFMAI